MSQASLLLLLAGIFLTFYPEFAQPCDCVEFRDNAIDLAVPVKILNPGHASRQSFWDAQYFFLIQGNCIQKVIIDDSIKTKLTGHHVLINDGKAKSVQEVFAGTPPGATVVSYFFDKWFGGDRLWLVYPNDVKFVCNNEVGHGEIKFICVDPASVSPGAGRTSSDMTNAKSRPRATLYMPATGGNSNDYNVNVWNYVQNSDGENQDGLVRTEIKPVTIGADVNQWKAESKSFSLKTFVSAHFGTIDTILSLDVKRMAIFGRSDLGRPMTAVMYYPLDSDPIGAYKWAIDPVKSLFDHFLEGILLCV